MEQHQELSQELSKELSKGFSRAPVTDPGRDFADAGHWEVTYLDGDSGRIRTASAERFACRWIRDEDSWTVVDAVRPRQGRAAA
jgi:hypothetical protein